MGWIACSDNQLASLQTILEQHLKWNRVLIVPRDEESVLIYQILDSLTLHQFIREGLLLDIGTGPGFPVTACYIFPDTHFTLVDPNDKKLGFADISNRYVT